MKLILLACLLTTHLQANQWTLLKSTSSPCAFTFEYPKAMELINAFGLGEPEEKLKNGHLLDIGFFKELGNNSIHPIDVSLAIDIFKKSISVDKWPGGSKVVEPKCDFFPWKNNVSTVTLPSGIQATEYRYCEEVPSEIGLTENVGDVVQFPHEIIVRIIKQPACTIKLTLQIPLLFEKDYSKIDWSLPPKDTPELRKKKLAIRNKLLRSFNSFRLLKK